LREGNKLEGLKKSEEVWASASTDPDPVVRIVAGIVVLEARVESGERDKALQALHEIEPVLTGFPELEWQALALASRADASYAGPAREVLLKIASQWGESVYNYYLARPDVNKLARPLMRPAQAAR
jgi:hypothetical protein